MTEYSTSYNNRSLTEEHISNIDDNEDFIFMSSGLPKHTSDDKLIDMYLESLEHHKIINSEIFEMEMRFKQYKREYGGVANTLNKQQFTDIIETLDNVSNSFTGSNLNITPINGGQPTYSLDITVHSNNYVNPSDDVSKLRFTINGMPGIGTFCKTNNIDIKNSNTDIIFKGNLPETYISPGKQSLNSEYSFGDLSRTNNTIDLEGVKTRIGGKFELVYNTKTRQFNFGSEFENPLIQELNKAGQEAMSKYLLMSKKNRGRVYKTFRLKERRSFVYDNCRIDMTKVKFSKVDIDTFYRENQIPVLEFIDSGISDSIESYEFEIEIINRKHLSKEDIKTSIQDGIDLYKLLMASADERLIFTNNFVAKDVKYLYTRLLKSLILKRIDNKLTLIDNQDIKPNDIPWSNATQIYSMSEDDKRRLKSDLIRLKDRYEDPDYELNKFISPKVVSINMDNVRYDNPDSISHDYCVTDKADGLSSLLFIVGDDMLEEYEKEKYNYLLGKAFLIDSNLNVSFSGNEFTDINKTYLFNGEFLNYTKNRTILNSYGIYDTYIENGNDVHGIELVSNNPETKTRIKTANDFLEQHPPVVVINEAVSIFVKEFYTPDKPVRDIFKCSEQIWNAKDEKPYKLDGLIYTPTKYPVGYNESIQYDLNPWITWTKNYKWKPPEDNTIDFLIRFDKELVSSYNGNNIYKNKEKVFKNTIMGGFNKYYIGNLYNTGREGEPKQNPCKDSSKSKTNFKRYKTKPIPFNPEHPLEEDIHFGLFKTNYENNVVDLEGNNIENDTIVEINYLDFNPSEESYIPNKNMRFNILRTRHDKTYEHRIATNEQKIRFRRIENIMSIIENHADSTRLSKNQKYFVRKYKGYFSSFLRGYDLDKDEKSYISQFKRNLSRIKSVYSSYEDMDFSSIKLNYGNSVMVAENIWSTIHNPVTTDIITTGLDIPSIDEEEKKYYNRKDNERKDKSITYNLQTFHNKIIKSRILLENAVNALRESDHTREISLLDLACGKGGDIGKWNDLNINNCVGIDIMYNNINDSVDGACERYNFYKQKLGSDKIADMKFLVGDIGANILNMEAFTRHPEYRNDAEKLWINRDGPEYSKNRFDIITSMFSLHYLFENKVRLDGFIQNISENLGNDGYFVGVCFDGKAIYNKLENHLMYESVEGYKDGSWIWKIIKNYQNFKDGLPDSEESLGVPIRVAMRSINKVIEEYLVNFDYLISELDKKGISILEDDNMNSMNLPIKHEKKISIGSLEDVYNMPITGSSKFNSILSSVKESLTPEEKEISFFNKYFIFTRKSDNAKIVESMSENLYIKLSSKGRKPSEQSLKDYISAQLSLEQNDVFNTNFINAKDIAIQRITKESELKKSKKKVIKITKPVVVNVAESDDDSSISLSGSVESGKSSTKSKTSAKKGISLGKTKKKLKIKNKSVDLSKKWMKLSKLIDKYHEIMVKTKSNNGDIDSKTLKTILGHCEKLNILAQDEQIKSNPQLSESVSKFEEFYEYFTSIQ